MRMNRVLFIILLILIASSVYKIAVSSKMGVYQEVVQAQIKVLEKKEILVSYLPLSIGEATLIQLPDNEFYLVDVGGKEAEKQMVSLLKQHGVQTLKGIFLTNPYDEHMGALDVVIQQFPVNTIYLPELTASTYHLSAFSQIKIRKVTKGDEIVLYPEVKIEVLSPSEPLSLSPQANSMVFLLKHKDIQFLFTSDINEEIEERLTSQFSLKSEILKVSDFGSNAGTSPVFLKEVDPHIGIIFSSDLETYPLSDDVIERLHESWTDVYILKRYGEIQVLSDGLNYEVDNIRDND